MAAAAPVASAAAASSGFAAQQQQQRQVGDPVVGVSPSGNKVTRTTVVRSATSAKDTILAWVQQTVNHYNVSCNEVSFFPLY